RDVPACAVLLVFSSDLADHVLLPPRDRQRLGDAVQHDFPMRIALVAHAALEAANRIARDEAVAMDADEARAEFLLELGKRLFQQELTLFRADRDVLELGLEIDDF